MKAFNMISLAAISTFSAAAMAVTVARPTITAPVIVPMVKPGTVGAEKMALPVPANLNEAQAVQTAGETCDPRKMYADLTEGTNTSPDAAQGFVAEGILQIAGNNCGHDAASMSVDARKVLLNTASCAQAKGIAQVGDYNTRVQILSGCQAAEKRALGMTSANENSEAANVKAVAEQCGYYKLAM